MSEKTLSFPLQQSELEQAVLEKLSKCMAADARDGRTIAVTRVYRVKLPAHTGKTNILLRVATEKSLFITTEEYPEQLAERWKKLHEQTGAEKPVFVLYDGGVTGMDLGGVTALVSSVAPDILLVDNSNQLPKPDDCPHSGMEELLKRLGRRGALPPVVIETVTIAPVGLVGRTLEHVLQDSITVRLDGHTGAEQK